MKLAKIEIGNFRCFESLTVALEPDVNVFVGINGAGKTTILDAIAIALYQIVAANGGGGKRQRAEQGAALLPTDIQIKPRKPGRPIRRAESVYFRATASDFHPVEGFPAKTPTGQLNTLDWTESIRYQPPSNFSYDTKASERLSALHAYFKAVWQEIEKSDEKALIPLPVVAYYRAHRRLEKMPALGNIFDVEFSRDKAFESALDAGVDFKPMLQWLYLRENTELRAKSSKGQGSKFEMPDLKAVRQSLVRTLANVRRVAFADAPARLVIERESHNGTMHELQLEQLSDGYRNHLALVLDFARRLAQAHPYWPDPLDAPGILLIDEIDLHLHPSWQQTVLPDLHSVFPNTQIIVATHSPHVVTTVEARGVHIVDGAKLSPCPAPTYGARSSDVVSEVMGLPSLRPPNNKIASKVSELFAAIDASDLEGAKTARADLDAWARGFPEPDLMRADVLIRRLQAQQQRKGGSAP